MEHRFLLLNRATTPPARFNDLHQTPGGLILRGDLAFCLADYFSWVPTEHPSVSRWMGTGLNFYGPTLITLRGAGKLREVCRALAGLFALGPSSLNLRGLYTTTEGSSETGHYEPLEVSRDDLVRLLSNLAEWADVVDRDAEMYILHLGL